MAKPITPSDISNFTTEQLSAEIERRKRKAEEERAAARVARAEQVRNTFLDLTAQYRMALIDGLVPKHGRTSCDDKNPENGFGSSVDGLPRCTRCALLGIGGMPDEFDIELTFRMSP